MISLPEPQGPRVTGFRTKLLLAMMVVVSSVTLLALYFAQRSLVANVEDDLQREFQSELAAFGRTQDVRRAALIDGFYRASIDHVFVPTDGPALEPLQALFATRLRQ